jgi:nucleoid-associated protein YgaU
VVAAGAGAGGASLPPGALYSVRRGDTLWSLAARFRGDGSQWPALWRAHQSLAAARGVALIDDPGRLVVGQSIWLPREGAAADGSGGRWTYHVQRGDTLSAIAWRVHGNAAQWPRIARDNGLADPDRLRPGQTLQLTPPARW